MNRSATDVFTVEDYRAMPVGPPYYQLIDGELLMSPSPNRYHQRVAGNVFRLLSNFVEQHALGVVYHAPLDVYLSDHDVVQPDILFVSHARKNRLADDGIHGAPDLVVEIISPSNGLLEKRRKLPLYARSGVLEEWLVDPHLEQIHRFDLTKDTIKPVALIDAHESFATPLLPGLAISAAAIFAQ